MIVYLNGKYVHLSQAKISIQDHGFLYGDGVYETIRVYGGKCADLRDHLKRLNASAREISLKIPISFEKLKKVVEKTIRLNRHSEAVVRITCTRGPGPYGFDPRKCIRPTLVISSMLFKAYSSAYYKKGIRAAVVGIRRNSPLSLSPRVKSTSCLNGILAKIESLQSQSQEGLMLSMEGNVVEGTVTNIFLVQKGILMTPSLGRDLLAGVTRQKVIHSAKKAKIQVKEQKISLGTLKKAREIFVTNTILEILPVTQLVITGKRPQKVGSGRVGPVTEDLMRLYKENARIRQS